MEKTNKVKNNTKKYILQTIGIVSVLAITIVILILCIGGCDSSDKKAVSTEKSASEDTTTDKVSSEQKTTDEKDMTEETTKMAIDSETDDKETDDETTDTEETTKNNQIAQSTTAAGQETTKSQQVVQKITTSGQTTGGNTQVVQNTTTSRPTTQKQTTTKKQEMTTKQQTTTAAPRGRNGVILEKLSQVIWDEVRPLPKTKTELVMQQGNPDAHGYGIIYNHPSVKDGIVFINNEIRFSHTTESELISIYGNPLTSYTTENGKFLVYQYGDYANGIEKEIIYITFGFANVLGMKLGSVAIGNVDDLGLAKFLN